ncbi:MAG: SH3 domain-containing protein [Anaerolineae bacterium]
MRTSKLVILVALTLLLVTTGCALVNTLVEYPTPTPKPQLALRPTFTPTTAPTSLPVTPTETALPTATSAPVSDPITPTVQSIAEQPTALVEPPTATPETPTATPTATNTPEPKAQVVVNNPRVNLRNGPGQTFDVLGQVLQGERLDIIGRDADSQWWQVCCFAGQPGWLAAEVVSAEGPLDAVAIAAGLAAPTVAPAAPTAQPVAAAATAAPAGTYPFVLTEEITFPYTQDFLRVGVKANDASDTPLAGYYMRVVNETTGQQWLSPATSSGPWLGTAPSATFADYRQANLIYDTRGKSTLTGNSFAVWLVNSAGRQVSPAVRYTQNDNDFRWLYVVWTRQ